MTVTRRNLLSCAAATVAAAAINLPVGAAQVGPIGLQLYTVRDIFEKNPLGTLEKVARIGYREVEFGGANYEKMDHALLRATLDRLGLKAPSIHVGFDALRNNFEQSVAMAKTPPISKPPGWVLPITITNSSSSTNRAGSACSIA